MSNESTGKRRRRIVRWIAGLLVLYVLSSGPVDHYLGEAMNPAIFMILYSPLIALAIFCPPFAHLLHWYGHLW